MLRNSIAPSQYLAPYSPDFWRLPINTYFLHEARVGSKRFCVEDEVKNAKEFGENFLWGRYTNSLIGLKNISKVSFSIQYLHSKHASFWKITFLFSEFFKMKDNFYGVKVIQTWLNIFHREISYYWYTIQTKVAINLSLCLK